MIEMGVVTNATKRIADGDHARCRRAAELRAGQRAWGSGRLLGCSSRGRLDMTLPTGGLFGAGSIINVAEGTIAAYDADAVDGFSAPGSAHEPGFDFRRTWRKPTSRPTTIAATSYVFSNGGR